MNLKQVLAHKDEILEIAQKSGFSTLGIHNRGTPWMVEDSEGNLPLAFVAASGSLVDVPACSARLELLLKCKVDIVTEDPKKADPLYLNNAVLLSDTNLEEKLISLFEFSLEEIKFTPLRPVEMDIAQGYVKKKDLLFQGPQVQKKTPSSVEEVDPLVSSFSTEFQHFLEDRLGGASKRSIEAVFHELETIYPEVKRHLIDRASDSTPKIGVK